MNRRSRHDHARRLSARRAAREGQQGDVARSLDGHTQPALVASAYAGHPPRQNLPALLNELRQDVRALVVDEVHLLDAELANFLLAEILALAAWPSTGTAWAARTTATRSAFTPRATVPAAWPVATVTTTTFTPRSSAGRCCLFLFLCHNYHPFTDRPDRIGINLLVKPAEPESLFLNSRILAAHGTSWSPRPAPALPPLEREPGPVCGADVARRASRASPKVFSGASSLRQGARSGT